MAKKSSKKTPQKQELHDNEIVKVLNGHVIPCQADFGYGTLPKTIKPDIDSLTPRQKAMIERAKARLKKAKCDSEKPED